MTTASWMETMGSAFSERLRQSPKTTRRRHQSMAGAERRLTAKDQVLARGSLAMITMIYRATAKRKREFQNLRRSRSQIL